MIILDTNVISEPTRPTPNANVVAWLHRQKFESLYTTATTLSELFFSIEALPSGRRRNTLRLATEALIDRFFGPRILPFDQAAAIVCGGIVARLRAAGDKPSYNDGQIIAIALVHGATVATRDTKPFLDAGLRVINPFQPGQDA